MLDYYPACSAILSDGIICFINADLLQYNTLHIIPVHEQIQIYQMHLASF